MKKILIALGIAIALFIIYVVIINEVAENQLKPEEEKTGEVICEEGWLNWTEYNETSGNYKYMPNNTYRCGIERFEVCDFVNESICVLSKEFIVEIEGNPKSIIKTGDIQPFGVGSSAIATQYRPPRWYGSFITQNTPRGTNIWTYLLKIKNFKLPIIIQDKSWWKYHYMVGALLIFGVIVTGFIEFLTYLNKKENNQKEYIDERRYDEYE